MNKGWSEVVTHPHRMPAAPSGAPGLRLHARLHADQRGAALDYVLVLGVIAVCVMALFDRLFMILMDYFGMIAYYVSWPFL